MEQIKEATGAVSEFFAGNPFASPVGAKIEQATDGSLASEDWALNMEICDLINMTEEGPREATRAIRKRLQTQMGKNNTAVMYSLTVLETAVKNCDRRFHQLIASKDFVNELVKLIGPKYDPPQVVQEKVLSLIQSWADAFRSQADLRGVVEVCAELKAKGVEFPPTDLDNLAPIATPQRKVPPAQPRPSTAIPQQPRFVPAPVGLPLTHSVVQNPYGPAPVAQQQWNYPAAAQHPPPQQPPQQQQQPQPHQPYSTQPTPEQLAKLRSELDIVNGNVGVLREMLSELVPGSETAEDLTLLQDLYKTCRAMQHRITTLLQTCANEEVTSELLVVNDELNSVFVKYERYTKNRGEGAAAAAPVNPTASVLTQPQASSTVPAEPSLIDLGASEPPPQAPAQALAAQMGAMNVTAAASTVGVEEVDITLDAAISSQRATETPAAEQKAEGVEREGDLAEMAAWLKDKPTEQANGDTTKEFDEFLATRAEKKE